MRLTSAVVSAIALAAIAISAAVVLDKDSPSDLAVRVEGVPGYVYYSRPYVITIQYVNNGSDTARSAELAASLPPGFALQGEHDGAPQGQRVVWNLGDLAAGEAGAIQFTILGTPPSDLTGAVYDLPGYVGHTAFEDGFRLAVELTSNAGRADALARADTGEPSSPTATSTPPPPTATATPTATSEPFFPEPTHADAIAHANLDANAAAATHGDRRPVAERGRHSAALYGRQRPRSTIASCYCRSPYCRFVSTAFDTPMPAGMIATRLAYVRHDTPRNSGRPHSRLQAQHR